MIFSSRRKTTHISRSKPQQSKQSMPTISRVHHLRRKFSRLDASLRTQKVFTSGCVPQDQAQVEVCFVLFGAKTILRRNTELCHISCLSPGDACKFQTQGPLRASQTPASVRGAPFVSNNGLPMKRRFTAALPRKISVCWF